jgi:hypothetical protein
VAPPKIAGGAHNAGEMSKGGWKAPGSALPEWTAEQVGEWVRSLVPNEQAHGTFAGYASSWKQECMDGRALEALSELQDAQLFQVLAQASFAPV